MNIAFNINKLALIGLGPTITSLLKNCSNPKELKFYFLCNQLIDNDKNNIIKLIQSEDGDINLINFIDIDIDSYFEKVSSLHGDKTTYARLLLPDKVKESKILYLDADLIIELDVLILKNFHFNNMLAAVPGSEIEFSLGSNFYLNIVRMLPKTLYFNAGIILFNLDKCRQSNFTNKVNVILSKFGCQLPSHDQSVLNILCHGNFDHLPSVFNKPWYNNSLNPIISDKVIFHFVGSPKPWDIFGAYLHNGFDIWNKYLEKEWKNKYYNLNYFNIVRTWQIRGGYFKILKNKFCD
jgi:lipopolysaccharide biosynthesis glycosyltransferase